VILVDDGVATGSTMLAAIRALRARQAKYIVVAVPVAPPSAVQVLQQEADEVLCLEKHEPFYSVGSWYADFRQVEDQEVQQALTGPART
jgi:putative phosphoribosyl transferase